MLSQPAGVRLAPTRGIRVALVSQIGLAPRRPTGAGLMRRCLRASALIFLAFSSISVYAAEPDPKPLINPAPTANDWAELAKLPDWSGIWVPKINDQHLQLTTNPPP